MEDITYNYHGGHPMSMDAHDSIVASKQSVRDRIVEYLQDHGPHTCDALEVALNLRHQTCSARVTELKAEGRIVERGRAATRSGRSACILVPVRLK